jgi:putative ABC transport system permease protein
LFGDALLLRSMAALLRVDPGFSTHGVLTMHLAVTRARYPSDPDVAAYLGRVLDRVRTVPGVTAAGFVNRLPLSGIAQTGPVEFEAAMGHAIQSDWRSASPAYFEAAGIPILRGRTFRDTDRDGAPLVAIIDQQFAVEVFGAADPLGRRVRISAGSLHGPWTEIVGVAGHIRNEGPDRDVRPQIYWPLAQRTQDRMVLVVRTAGRPESFTPAVVEQIHRENPGQPVYDVRSMQQWLDRNLQPRHVTTVLVSLFGIASLLLSCLGLYGVVAYAAGQRMREFGIRMALGADAAAIRRLVLGHAAKLALIGSAIGLALAWPVGRALGTVLFGVGAADPISLTVAPALLLAVALAAGLAPARRAASADPGVTLRAS